MSVFGWAANLLLTANCRVCMEPTLKYYFRWDMISGMKRCSFTGETVPDIMDMDYGYGYNLFCPG